MPRQLIVDIGNSSAKAALFEGDKITEECRLEHDALACFFAESGKDGTIHAAIVSSDIPLGEEVEQAIMSLP